MSTGNQAGAALRWIPCCRHCVTCGPDEGGHDDTCRYGCNDGPVPDGMGGCVHTWEHKGETFRCGYPTIPASSFCGLHSLAADGERQ